MNHKTSTAIGSAQVSLKAAHQVLNLVCEVVDRVGHQNAELFRWDMQRISELPTVAILLVNEATEQLSGLEVDDPIASTAPGPTPLPGNDR